MDISLQLSVNVTKHGRKFVAYSPALDISTVGNSEKQAKERFGDLVELFFQEVSQSSNLDTVLNELGWKKVKKVWHPPKTSNTSIDVRVPVAV